MTAQLISATRSTTNIAYTPVVREATARRSRLHLPTAARTIRVPGPVHNFPCWKASLLQDL